MNPERRALCFGISVSTFVIGWLGIFCSNILECSKSPSLIAQKYCSMNADLMTLIGISLLFFCLGFTIVSLLFMVYQGKRKDVI